ncbi:MAG: LamG domain-containing protein, partial [Bacilli bacterium]
MAETKTYKALDRPYDNFLTRDSQSKSVSSSTTPKAASGESSSSSSSGSGGSSDSNGSVEEAAVKNEGNIKDLWIKTFIRSNDWKPKKKGFYMDGRNGYAEFVNVFISGEIEALTGEIGGFVIGATELTADAGENRTGLSSGNTSFYSGPKNAPTVRITQEGRILVGADNPIVIDGVYKEIESDNYTSGAFGTGFHLDSNLFEVGNIACRGIFRASVFQKDIVNVIAGSFVVSPNGDTLDEDMTQLDNSTLKTKGSATFAVGDILRIKESNGATVDDEWLIVTDISSAPIYSVTRDVSTNYNSNDNPAWKKGSAVVDYGQSGDGGVYMTASDNNSPYISVFEHSGAPWSSIDTKLRLGNLNGFLGYSENLFGIAIGDSERFLKYDSDNGLRIQGNIIITNPGDINASDITNDLNWSSITTFLQDSIPVSVSIGDIWIDTNDNNNMYRAASAGADQISVGEWVLITNTGGAAVFTQDAVPTSISVGDIWFDTNDGNKMYKADSIGADQIAVGEWVVAPVDFANITGATKPDDNATVGAVWGSNLSGIPATLGAPSGTGLFLSATNLGYYDDGAWKTYMDSSGNFVLGDIAGGHAGLSWNQSLGTLAIIGGITIGIETDFEPGYDPSTKITTFRQTPTYTEFGSSSLGSDASVKAYYKFSSGAATTDSSGNSHTLTAISAPAAVTGKFGNGAYFITDDAYSIVDHADLKPSGDWSICAWIKTSISTGDQSIFSSWSEQSVKYCGILFRISSGIVNIISAKNTGVTSHVDFEYISGTTNVSNDSWHFVVATSDGVNLKVYVDGVLEGTISWAHDSVWGAGTNYVRVANRSDTGTNQDFFNGTIDDLVLFNGKSLTSTEIYTLYCEGPTSLSVGDIWINTDNNNTPYVAASADCVYINESEWVESENPV